MNKRKMLIIKYIPAYFDKKARPSKIPSIIKLIKDGFFLICNKTINETIQKNNKTTSVETKKEDMLTAGITKKLNAENNAIFFFISNLRQKT